MSGLSMQRPRRRVASFNLAETVRYIAVTCPEAMPLDFGVPEGFDFRRRVLELDAQEGRIFRRVQP